MGLECMIRLFVGFRQDQETNLFVGSCPNLGVYSQGVTQQEAEEGKSAIDLFLKHGGFEKLLKEKGLNTVTLCPERSFTAHNYNRKLQKCR